MKFFPNKFNFIIFKTGYTSRLDGKELSDLNNFNFEFFGNVLDKYWKEDCQGEYDTQNLEELKVINKKLKLSDGSLVFSVKKEISPIDINDLIYQINDNFSYCAFFDWNNVYDIEKKKIKINGEFKTFLILDFDTESG